MLEIISISPFFGLSLSVGMFLVGTKMYKKWPIPLFNPLVFAIISIIIILLSFDISYQNFNEGGQFINLLITPATVALAIKLEKNIHYLKKYYAAILIGIFFGVFAHTLVVTALALLFQFNEELVATLLPKSITTAIAVGVSESLGGISSLTVAIVVLTGIIGAVAGPPIFKQFNITDPVAQGISLGSGSHAMGTSKAIQLGDVQGAMSGLAIVLTGIAVVLIAPLAMEIILLWFF